MVRPRWHDVLIITGIVVLLSAGIMALWADDVRDLLHLGPGRGAGSGTPLPSETSGGQT
ncbi:MAG: hypothetical protein WKG01_23660 [Kofleriaceae bacterium]